MSDVCLKRYEFYPVPDLIIGGMKGSWEERNIEEVEGNEYSGVEYVYENVCVLCQGDYEKIYIVVDDRIDTKDGMDYVDVVGYIDHEQVIYGTIPVEHLEDGLISMSKKIEEKLKGKS